MIKGKQTILMPMTLQHVTERYLGWLNDPEVTFYLSSGKQTLDQLKQYVSERITNPNVRFWAIHEIESGTHIGNVKLEPIFWEVSRATFGILIGDRHYWGKGISTEVTALVAEHAFRELKLRKVDLGVSAENKAAIKSYEKAGFHVEGHFRNHVLLHGKVSDSIYMARFSES